MGEFRYFSVPLGVREDGRLSAGEKLLLMTLFSYVEEMDEGIYNPVRKLAADLAVEQGKIKKSLSRLEELDWLIRREKGDKMVYFLNLPGEICSGEPGSRLARAWPRYFGTSQLTPFMFAKLKAFLEDGLEERLVIQVMKLAARKAEGNPFNYIESILSDFREQEIFSLEDYREKRGENKNGQGLQKTYKGKEKRTPAEELEELYRQGYR
ncbi:MAG: DnaD domain protein [Halanaerobiaceae bacterium]